MTKEKNKENKLVNVEKQSDEIIEVSAKEFDELARQAAEYKDKHLRLYAEFDNARKRMERDKLEFVKFSNEILLRDFLDVLDDMERTISVAKEKHQDYEAFLQGIELVLKRMNDLMKRNVVKPIEAKGKMFDPHLHEVMMQEETDKVKDGTVLEEFQKGYLYNDRVLRTAKVKVAKNKSEDLKENEAKEDIKREEQSGNINENKVD